MNMMMNMMTYFISFNGHRHRLIHNGLFQILHSVWDVNKGIDLCSWYGLAESLFDHAAPEPAFVSDVGIILFGTNTGRVFIKQKGVVHETAAATQIEGIAVDEFVFG